MNKFTVRYNIRFVSGNLIGLTHEQILTYPVSSLERVTKEFEDDVNSERVIGGSSAYIITDFTIEY